MPLPSSQYIFWPITLPEENPSSPKQDPSLSPVQPLPPPLPPRTRSRKSTKQVAPKRAPQRGLGVAQLERLRMEQAGETEFLMHQTRRSVVPPQMLVRPYPSQTMSGGGLLPGAYPMECLGPEGFMGRYLVPPPPAPEPPSTQMLARHLFSPPVDPVQCLSDQCEYCVRKKRLFGEGSVYENLDGANPLAMDLMAAFTPSAHLEGAQMTYEERRKVPNVVPRQTREYQFFPTYGGGQSEVVYPTVGDGSTSAHSASAYPSQPIDLSLKLSY